MKTIDPSRALNAIGSELAASAQRGGQARVHLDKALFAKVGAICYTRAEKLYYDETWLA